MCLRREGVAGVARGAMAKGPKIKELGDKLKVESQDSGDLAGGSRHRVRVVGARAQRPVRPSRPMSARLRLIAERAAAAGVMPLEVMLATMREWWRQALYDDDGRLRDRMDMTAASKAADMAERAAPYTHPRLAALSAVVQDAEPARVIAARDLTPEEWEAEGRRIIDGEATKGSAAADGPASAEGPDGAA